MFSEATKSKDTTPLYYLLNLSFWLPYFKFLMHEELLFYILGSTSSPFTEVCSFLQCQQSLVSYPYMYTYLAAFFIHFLSLCWYTVSITIAIIFDTWWNKSSWLMFCNAYCLFLALCIFSSQISNFKYANPAHHSF